MADQRLIDYVNQCRQTGATDDKIRSVLLNSGWQAPQIDEVLSASSHQSSPVTPQGKLRPKAVFIIAGILVGVLLIGGSAFGYFYYLRETPEKVLQKMYVNLLNVKSLEYSGEFRIHAQGNFFPASGLTTSTIQPQPNNVQLAIRLNGSADWHDKQNPKGNATLDLAIDGLDSGGLAPASFSAGLESRYLDKAFYLKLSNLPVIQAFDISAIKDTWIKLDIQSTGQTYLKQSPLDTAVENQKQPLTEDQTKQIKQAIIDSRVFRIVSQGSDNIDGVDTYHYGIVLDKPALGNLAEEISRIAQNNQGFSPDALKTFKEDLEKADFPTIEVWIGKKDYLPYKIYAISNIKTSQANASGEITVTVLFKNFDKPVTVETPSPVKPLEEIIGGIFSSFSGSDSKSGKPHSVKPPSHTR